MNETKVKASKVRISENDVGKLVLVRFDDVGRIEGLLVDIEDSGSCRVYFPGDKQTNNVEADQIVEVGKRIEFGKV